jgi:hypothetical protein
MGVLKIKIKTLKMIFDRKCLICGKPMKIKIEDKTNGILTRGVFFTRMKIPTKDAKVIKKSIAQ